MEHENYCLGIDFGTTNSKMAYWFLEQPTIIKDDLGNVNIPSVVFFKNNEEIVIGTAAKGNLVPFPDRTVASVKRQMGSDFKYKINGEKYPPEYIGALIFRYLIDIAKKQVGIDFVDAVVSVPANYTDSQRYAIKDAAEMAGLNIKRMINEPTAAALAYGLGKANRTKTILVYDFGGGTFDVSILKISKNFFNVKASSGLNRCGGDDIDDRLVNYLSTNIKKQLKFDVKNDLKIRQILRDAAEKTKIELSTSETTTINLPFLKNDGNGLPIAYSQELTRSTFNSLINDLIQSTKQPILDVLQKAGLSLTDMDDIILVGGTTKIPAVQTFVEELCGKKPLMDLDPHEIVALGAAIASAENTNYQIGNKVTAIEISDVISHSFEVHVYPEFVKHIIEKNDKLPLERSDLFSNITSFTKEVVVEVYEGESDIIEEENFIGSFYIDVVPKPMGENRIQVRFEIGSEYGILNVTATDLDSGLERKVRMEAKSRLGMQEKLKWTQKLHSEGIITLLIVNETQKIDISMILPTFLTVDQIKDRLLQRKVFSAEDEPNYELYYENKILTNDLVVKTIISDHDTKKRLQFILRLKNKI